MSDEQNNKLSQDGDKLPEGDEIKIRPWTHPDQFRPGCENLLKCLKAFLTKNFPPEPSYPPSRRTRRYYR